MVPEEENINNTEAAEEEIEQRELDLENPDDLTVFLESADDIYIEARQFEELAKSDNYQSLSIEGIESGDVFEILNQKLIDLKSLINLCRYELVPNQEEISDEKIELMQNLYDDMINLRNHIFAAYANIGPQLSPEEVMVEVESIDEIDETEDFTVEDYSEVENSEVETYEITPEITPRVVSSPESKEDDLLQAEKILAEVKSHLEAVLKNIDESFSESDRTSDIKNDIEEIASFQIRVDFLNKKIQEIEDSNEDPVVVKSKLSKYIKVAEDIRINVDTLEQDLLQRQVEAESESGETEPEKAVVKKEEEPKNVPKNEQTERVEDEDSEMKKEEDEKEEKVPIIIKRETEQEKKNPNYQPKTKPKPKSEETRTDKNKENFEPKNSVKRKTMNIVADNADGDISISIAKSIEEKLGPIKKPKNVESEKTDFSRLQQVAVGNKIKSINSGVIARAESKDPINKAVPGVTSKIRPADKVHEKVSLTKKYLSDDRYISFIKSRYSSPSAFERILDASITRREEKTMDRLERWLNEGKKSPFAYLQDMTVDEVVGLSMQNDVRELITSEGMKYETFIYWIDLIPEMLEVVEENPSMKFGELYAIWIIETEIIKAESARLAA